MYPTTSTNPSQGYLKIDGYTFSYWQYVDVLVFWGGSAGEGLILAPSPDAIDAAHRNGVPILGTIFLPPVAYGGKIDYVNDLIQKSDSIFPVADKLIEVAEYYGFEGWFINQETGGGSAPMASQMQEFMKYIKNKRPNMIVEWYDAMINSGAVSWQNALDSLNQMFFQDGSTRVSDYMFLNFGWGGSIAISRTKAQNLGRSEYDLFGGVDVQANGYNTSVAWTAIFPEGQPHVASLGFYCPNWTYTNSSSNINFIARDNYFWVGPTGDPGNPNPSATWKGIAYYIPEKSPITAIPFVTNFCLGNGSKFWVNGQQLRTGEWYNRSLQDVLPTYRWWMVSGTKPTWDYTDAYYGGNCLNLSTAAEVKFFKTELALTSTSNLQVAVKTAAAGATNLQVGMSFEGSEGSFTYIDVGSTTSTDWELKTIGLGDNSGKTVAVISLKYTGSSAIKVGRIGVIDGDVDIPSAPSGVSIVNKYEDIPGIASLRLQWPHTPSPLYYYNVYRRNPDYSLTYLGGTPNNAYFVSKVDQVGNETSVTIEVEAVGKEFGHSEHATATFNWNPPMPPSAATIPSPADSLPFATTTPMLNWTAGAYTLSHDVYFGTSNPPPFIGNQTGTTYTPGTLPVNTQYYWRIDEKNNNGTTTGTLWTFTTIPDSAQRIDRTDEGGGIISARGDNASSGEGKDKAFDNKTSTKFLDFSATTWIQYHFGSGHRYALLEYTIASANDFPERDPKRWTLKGSDDSVTWTLLDQRTNIDYPNRYQTLTFSINNSTPYKYYRFDLWNHTGTITQLSEIELVEYIIPGQTGVKNSNDDKLPREFVLEQNYPNPFNSQTNIRFFLPISSQVTINIFSVTGELVTCLSDGNMGRGYHDIQWLGKDSRGREVATGVYFMKFFYTDSKHKSGSAVRKLIYLR